MAGSGGCMALIYIVEDDPLFAASTQSLLVINGHSVEVFKSPHAFMHQLVKLPPKCAIVDWMLPEMLGIDVVRRVRETVGRSVGVLMLTAMDAEENVVQALECGADDYMVKPGSDPILVARLEALLRRLDQGADPRKKLLIGVYDLDFRQQCVRVDGQAVELTPREFDLAWTLFNQPARLFTKQELLAAIWGKDSDCGFHTISQHIYSIRKKLSLMEHGFRLVAVYGTGYRFELPAS
jgi:DNA-binding response OmpR family regulator